MVKVTFGANKSRQEALFVLVRRCYIYGAYSIPHGEIKTALATHAGIFDQVTEARLVIWDQWDGNILISFIDPEKKSGASVAGTIDYERALWGDPLMETTFRALQAPVALVEAYRTTSARAGHELAQKVYMRHDLHLSLIWIIEVTFRGLQELEHGGKDMEGYGRAGLQMSLNGLKAWSEGYSPLIMASFPKSLLRALKKMATSTSTTEQKKIPYNLFIFPESLLDKSLAKGALARTYTPNELLQFILKYAVNSVDSIRVTSLSYHKETNKAQHEYLIIKVEDSKDNLSNFIKIDRCPVHLYNVKTSEIKNYKAFHTSHNKYPLALPAGGYRMVLITTRCRGKTRVSWPVSLDFNKRAKPNSKKPSARLQPNTPVLFAHVVVHVVAFLEPGQANPTHVRTTDGAHHVVAARNLLDGCGAVGAWLDIVCRAPSVERFLNLRLVVARLVIRARDPFMLLDVTICTDVDKTKAALHDGVLGANAQREPGKQHKTTHLDRLGERVG
ncbi:APH domain-containing protein [Ceratobasidium theobromae]|uniref:APH domain-containing protein n=1 Tax=Ceratobasidium theobromae TaxID=1582974 RepID=A0A5N5QAW2_9AGAM|nr:APH domain-containing protein [Ceratobasidium theobromae]